MAEHPGFNPSVRFVGPVDTLNPEEVADHLIAVLREALSNAARHAHASKVDVALSADGSTATFTVLDDGVGSLPTRPGAAAWPTSVGVATSSAAPSPSNPARTAVRALLDAHTITCPSCETSGERRGAMEPAAALVD